MNIVQTFYDDMAVQYDKLFLIGKRRQKKRLQF